MPTSNSVTLAPGQVYTNKDFPNSGFYQPKDVISTYSGNGPAGSGLDQFMGQMTPDRNAINASQKADIGDYLSRFTSAINNQETLPSMYQRIGRELNLPILQQNATAINTAAANIPWTYSSAARGFDVNQNQLDRTIGQKTYEITPALQTANTALSAAQNILGQRIGFEQAQQAKQLLPIQTEKEMLSDRLAREYTGFSTDQEAKLNSYIQKMQGGIQLSRGEQQEAEQLAAAKLQADAIKYQADKQLEGTKYTADKNPFGI